MGSTGAIIKKHWHLIVFVICLIILVWTISKLIGVVLPFLVGLIIAYLLLPVVRWLEKRLPGGKKHPGFKRISIIIGVYFASLIAMAGLAFYVYSVVSNSASQLWESMPAMITDLVARVQDLLAAVRLQVPESMQQQYDQTIKDAGVTAVNVLRNGLGQGFSFAVSGAGMVLGFLSLPLLVFFMLKDWDHLRDGLFGTMPSWAGEHARQVASILDRVLGRYFRAQLVMSGIIGVLVFIMLTVLGIPFAPALALWAALMENIPTFGPWLNISVGIAIALATKPDKALWILIGYAIIWLVENNIITPRIQGAAMKMNPIFVLLVSVIGAHLYGLVGFIIALPVSATIIELLKYFRLSIKAKETE